VKKILFLASLALVAACAGAPGIPADTEAVRDYVQVGELGQVDQIRTHNSDAWTPVTRHFAMYKARDGHFLLEFTRVCREMYDNTTITPDRRYDHNVIRRRFDTLRGCRIDGMYPLTEAQVLEIEALVKTAGSGN